MAEILVSSEWLNEHLNDPNLIILDASEETNVAGKKVEFEGLQIKGARYFDLEKKFSDTTSKLPHTFPSTEQFEKESQKLGINNNSVIVVYDNIGIYTSPRVWWMYKIMGHKQIYVLDGGLSDWVKKGFETEKQERRNYSKGNFKARLASGHIDTKEDMLENLHSKKKIVIDARSAGRFNGTAPEPRDWVENGHIPGSLNLPFDSLIEGGKYKSKEEIKKLFKALKIEDQPLSFVCGSGLTSCILLLASELIQDNPLSVYDGSWTEWGSNKALPKAKR
jgi:thiosulfate/3-mercaptopyruvate sulfurtransferase